VTGSYKVYAADAAGNLSAASTNGITIAILDHTAPSASLTAVALANNGNAVVQSSETGTAYLVDSTATVTDVASILALAESQWNAGTIATADLATDLSVLGLAADVYKLYVADAAGNLSTAAGNTVVVTNTDDANRIDLTDANMAGEEGNLIKPVYVDGKWYFYWDRSGDGTSGSADYTTHDVLDGIFTFDRSGNSGGNGDTTNTFRYATLNGVDVALPTYGAAVNSSGIATPPQGMDAYQNGTAIDNNPVGENNVTYDDLLAIWDAYNGSGTGTSTNGTPPGWQASWYWSATPASYGHANVYYGGYVGYGTVGYGNVYVALEVW
jgi:hypothetical protein